MPVCELVVLILELRARLILINKSFLQYEENQQWLEIRAAVIPVRWGSACSPPHALCRRLPRVATLPSSHLMFCSLYSQAFWGELRWHSCLRLTSNAKFLLPSHKWRKQWWWEETINQDWGGFYSGIFDRMNDQRRNLKYTDNVSRILWDLTGWVSQIIPDTKCSL